MSERVVLKYALIEAVNRIATRANPIVVHIGNQRNVLTAWIEQDCDNHLALDPVVLEVVGTGVPFDRTLSAPAVHVGSAILSDGAFVFHVYERGAVT